MKFWNLVYTWKGGWKDSWRRKVNQEEGGEPQLIMELMCHDDLDFHCLTISSSFLVGARCVPPFLRSCAFPRSVFITGPGIQFQWVCLGQDKLSEHACTIWMCWDCGLEDPRLRQNSSAHCVSSVTTAR